MVLKEITKSQGWMKWRINENLKYVHKMNSRKRELRSYQFVIPPLPFGVGRDKDWHTKIDEMNSSKYTKGTVSFFEIYKRNILNDIWHI